MSSTYVIRSFCSPVLLGRLLVAALCLVLATMVADPADISSQLQVVSLDSVVGSVALHAAIVAALAWRWRASVHAIGPTLPFRQALRLTFTSTLLNLLLPTTVGGDVSRVWLGRRHGLDLGEGAAVAAFDRIVGLVTLVLLVALSATLVPGLLPNEARWLLILVPLCHSGSAPACCR
jgi:glycosyltransferase 2 family protein